MGQSEKVYENNGDRAVFSAGCGMERSEDESAYGRERPRLRLPREILALVVPALSVPRVNPKPDHSLISSASRMYRNRIGTEGTHETLHEQSRSPGDISIGSECGGDLV